MKEKEIKPKEITREEFLSICESSLNTLLGRMCGLQGQLQTDQNHAMAITNLVRKSHQYEADPNFNVKYFDVEGQVTIQLIPKKKLGFIKE